MYKMIFKDRVFNAALAISLVWHVFWSLAVNITVVPGRFRLRELTSVSFLGPILESTALDIMLSSKPVDVSTTYQYKVLPAPAVIRQNVEPSQDGVKAAIAASSESRLERMPFRLSAGDKEKPAIITKTGKRHAAMRYDKEISGDVAEREIIYKPEKPGLPHWIEPKSSFRVQLDFTVSPQGDIKKIVPVVSSGDPEIDMLGIRYLKSWRFAPLADGADKEQPGRADFVFHGD